MSTTINFFTCGICVISAIAAVTDLAVGRIYNWLTVLAFVVGVVASLVAGGWHGGLSSLQGALAGFVIYGLLYLLRAMSAGDVKLLMALGAWGGPHYVEEVAALGLMLGGALALGMLIGSGRIAGFFKRMKWFIETLLIKDLEAELPKIDWGFTVPFGVPIALAAIWVALAHPLRKWGIPLWP